MKIRLNTHHLSGDDFDVGVNVDAHGNARVDVAIMAVLQQAGRLRRTGVTQSPNSYVANYCRAVDSNKQYCRKDLYHVSGQQGDALDRQMTMPCRVGLETARGMSHHSDHQP